jgi:hypothetical protein
VHPHHSFFTPFSHALPENGHNRFLNAGVVGVIEVTRRVESAYESQDAPAVMPGLLFRHMIVPRVEPGCRNETTNADDYIRASHALPRASTSRHPTVPRKI